MSTQKQYPKAKVLTAADAEGWREVVVEGAPMGHVREVIDAQAEGLEGYLSDAKWIWRPASTGEGQPLTHLGIVKSLAEAAYDDQHGH